MHTGYIFLCLNLPSRLHFLCKEIVNDVYNKYNVALQCLNNEGTEHIWIFKKYTHTTIIFEVLTGN